MGILISYSFRWDARLGSTVRAVGVQSDPKYLKSCHKMAAHSRLGRLPGWPLASACAWPAACQLGASSESPASPPESTSGPGWWSSRSAPIRRVGQTAQSGSWSRHRSSSPTLGRMTTPSEAADDTRPDAPDRVDPGGACPAAAGGAERLRADIRAAAPDAQEAISYGVPAFKYRVLRVVSWGAAKTHAAFYVRARR